MAQITDIFQLACGKTSIKFSKEELKKN